MPPRLIVVFRADIWSKPLFTSRHLFAAVYLSTSLVGFIHLVTVKVRCPNLRYHWDGRERAERHCEIFRCSLHLSAIATLGPSKLKRRVSFTLNSFDTSLCQLRESNRSLYDVSSKALQYQFQPHPEHKNSLLHKIITACHQSPKSQHEIAPLLRPEVQRSGDHRCNACSRRDCHPAEASSHKSLISQ